ncbi:HNH endonuclease [Lactobacillus phage Ldl1]|uniref:HNH endonuclease n=1 Tax=Lactobacillus phage Ldl1 TaxID=1552735 RepID=A0A0A7DMT0_9CAUD|nr:HNH endonuclease [Lactobacillus phage Ldl1]AIS73913.1 HNH endonuclease [Lactobacillus phage Ldl1]
MSKEDQEIWEVYPDPKYPFIEASNLGRIRTKDRVVTGKDRKKYHINGRVLKQYFSSNGYMYVTFSMNDKTVHLSVHRVIATSFLPNPDNYSEVNHIDCNPANNVASNLEWCTHQENVAYRDKLGHYVNNSPSRPVIAINPNTSKVLWFESQHEAGRQLGVYQTNITQVVKGKRYHKTAGGYWFCYADENAVEKVRSQFGDEVAEKVEKLMNEA